MIDEAYAVTAASKEEWTGWRLISLQLAFQAYWVGGGLAGVWASALLPAHVEGLEFSLCALFVTLALDAARTRKQVPSLLLAALSIGAALLVAPEASLFVGLVIFLVLLIVRFAMGRRRGVPNA
jgi:predicted branched-subunit amino acid permease